MFVTERKYNLNFPKNVPPLVKHQWHSRFGICQTLIIGSLQMGAGLFVDEAVRR